LGPENLELGPEKAARRPEKVARGSSQLDSPRSFFHIPVIVLAATRALNQPGGRRSSDSAHTTADAR
jgi:hypothetical protein